MKNIISKMKLFSWQAPSFNFEKNPEQLLEHALKVGFVSKVGEDQYLINEEYWEGKKK